MKLFSKRKKAIDAIVADIKVGDITGAIADAKAVAFDIADEAISWADDEVNNLIDLKGIDIPKANSNKTKLLLAYNAGDYQSGLTDEQVSTLTGVAVTAVGTARRALIKAGLVEKSPNNIHAFVITRVGLAVLDVVIEDIINL